MPSLTAREAVTVPEKPLAEVLVEGELSPFEHEALYRILRKGFKLEHPSYTELVDEDLATRINVTFHYPYITTIFTDVLQENWRDLKEFSDRSDIEEERQAPQLHSLSSGRGIGWFSSPEF